MNRLITSALAATVLSATVLSTTVLGVAGTVPTAAAATNVMDGNRCRFTYTAEENQLQPDLTWLKTRTAIESDIAINWIKTKAFFGADAQHTAAAESILPALEACKYGRDYAPNNPFSTSSNGGKLDSTATIGLSVGGALLGLILVMAIVVPALRPVLAENFHIHI